MERPTGETLTATLDAEEALLGSILVESSGEDKEAINKVRQMLQPGEFYRETNRFIYEAMLACPDAPNVISVARELNNWGRLESVGCAYLMHLISLCPVSIDYLSYARTVKHYATQRTVTYYANKGQLEKAEKVLSRDKFKGGVEL